MNNPVVVTELERGLPRLDHEHFRVRVPVPSGPSAGRRVYEDDRERNLMVIRADELVRVLRSRQVVGS